jgi:signal transduction histidine kinase
LDAAKALLDVALRDIRDIIAGRSPGCSTRDNIVSSIKRLVRELAETTGIEIELVEAFGSEKLTRPIETALYRILQESLNNAVRHSGSNRIRVAIAENPGTLRLEVRDWGKGFDRNAINGEHRGLHGIQQRAQLLGGTAAIDSKPGQGTLIEVELPLPKANQGL